MPALKPSSLDEILPLIVDKLISDNVFSGPNLCFLSDQDENPYYPPADRYAVVVAGNGKMWEQSEVGGGRAVTIVDQEVVVAVWQRNASDIAGHATQILADQARGVLRLAHDVIDSLHEWFPQDTDGNVYAVEGLRWTNQDRATRMRGNEEWIRRRCSFRLIYQMRLTKDGKVI